MNYANFEKICKEKNTTPSAVTAKLGLSSGSVSNWKRGVIPNGEALLKLADYLECSTDYLLGRTNTPVLKKSLTEDEQELLNTYKSLTLKGKILVKAQALQKLTDCFEFPANEPPGCAAPPIQEQNLTEDEQELINIYKSLNKMGRALVQAEAYREYDKGRIEN
ncbi:MAG: helix-turn-helix domain-containing protein [Oscillospiraceae bacterium]|nr:helix-turn-helix domain-containing protein [Oscillospiraceae bacterium]